MAEVVFCLFSAPPGLHQPTIPCCRHLKCGEAEQVFRQGEKVGARHRDAKFPRDAADASAVLTTTVNAASHTSRGSSQTMFLSFEKLYICWVMRFKVAPFPPFPLSPGHREEIFHQRSESGESGLRE